MKQSTKCILKSLFIQGGIALLIVVGGILLVSVINWVSGQISEGIVPYQSSTSTSGLLILIVCLTLAGIAFYYGTIKPCLIKENEK